MKSTKSAPSTPVLARGTRGTYSGFPATVIRHYSGNMYEIRTAGGFACVDAKDFKISAPRAR